MSRVLALVMLLASAAPAGADKLKWNGLFDAAVGVSIPVGDSNYNRFADPTFKLSLRGGAEIWLTNRFAVAPELALDFIPVKTDDGTFRPAGAGIDTSFFRFRVLAGARLLWNLGICALFARFGIGLDYITGSERASILGLNINLNLSSTAFTLEPGVGVQFHFLKYGIAGGTLGFPVAFHNFNKNDAANNSAFTAVDLDILAFAGARI